MGPSTLVSTTSTDAPFRQALLAVLETNAPQQEGCLIPPGRRPPGGAFRARRSYPGDDGGPLGSTDLERLIRADDAGSIYFLSLWN